MRHVPKPAVPTSQNAAVRVAPRLTGVERDILDFMVLYLRTHTYQPSIREIGEQFGIKSTKTVSEHLQSLADKGFLERDPSRSRGVRIVGLDLNPQTVTVPCYRDLEEAASGRRTGARRGQAPPSLSLDRQLVGGKGCFMVRCPGNRLAAAGIEDGDFLVIEPVLAEELSTGEVVAARVGGVHDYYRLRRNGGEMSLYAIGRPPAGAAPASTRVKSSSLLLVGRVSAIYRRMDAVPFTGSDATH